MTMLRGTVLSPGGAPVADAPVWARLSEIANASTNTINANAEGEFAFFGLPEGTYEVWTEAGTGDQAVRERLLVKLEMGQTMEVTLEMPELVRISGNLLLSGELPPERFSVQLIDDQGGRVELPLDENAHFDMQLRPGTYQVALVTEIFGVTILDEPMVVAASPADQTHEIRAEAVPVTARVIMPEGIEEFPGGTLIANYTSFDNAMVTRIRMIEPEYVLNGVIKGSYALGFNIEGGFLQGQSEPVAVGPGEPNVIEITLTEPREMAFEGTIRLPEGEYEYKFFAPPDNWLADPLNPQTTGEGVLTNSVVRMPGGASAGGRRSSWPRMNDETGDTTFAVRMPAPLGRVYVRGTFNQWRIDPAYELKNVEEAVFTYTMTLEPGRHEYKFYFPGEDTWSLDPRNPAQAGEGAFANSVVEVLPPGSQRPLVIGEMMPRVDYETGEVTFELNLPAYIEEVYLMGDFNNWEMREEFKMTR